MSQILKTKYGTIERNYLKIDGFRYQEIIKKTHSGRLKSRLLVRFHKQLKRPISSRCYQYKHDLCENPDCECHCHIDHPTIS